MTKLPWGSGGWVLLCEEEGSGLERAWEKEGRQTIDEGREAALGTHAEMNHFEEGADEGNSFVVKCQKTSQQRREW
jgi:hypothetical protein